MATTSVHLLPMAEGTMKSVAWARNVHRPRITQSHHKEVVGTLFAHSAMVVLQGEGICYRPCTGLSLFADYDVDIAAQFVS